jgi:serine phosphatase RsbU (regulator of sigma subunit)
MPHERQVLAEPSFPLTAIAGMENYAQHIVDTMRESILVLDHDLRVVSSNRSFYRTFQVTPSETVGRLVYDLGDGQWDIPALRRLLEIVLPQHASFDDFEVAHRFQDIGEKVMLLNARTIFRPGNHSQLILLAIEDATERRAAERTLRAAYEREKRVADALQRPLMLETPEDAFPGLGVGMLYKAVSTDAAKVGGDFFDAFPLVDGRTAFLLGDVTGHGLPAAARATEVKDVLRAFLRLHPFYPAVTLTRLNDYLCDAQALDDHDEDTILGLSLVLVDVRANEATFAWGGIDAPLILKAGGAITPLTGGGTLLGALAHATFAEVTVPLLPGDGFLLHTDGISEARRGKVFLDQEGVIELLQVARERDTVRGIARELLQGAEAFANGHLHDDACLVLVKRL